MCNSNRVLDQASGLTPCKKSVCDGERKKRERDFAGDNKRVRTSKKEQDERGIRAHCVHVCVCVFMCLCVCERARERERKCENERENERDKEREKKKSESETGTKKKREQEREREKETEYWRMRTCESVLVIFSQCLQIYLREIMK